MFSLNFKGVNVYLSLTYTRLLPKYSDFVNSSSDWIEFSKRVKCISPSSLQFKNINFAPNDPDQIGTRRGSPSLQIRPEMNSTDKDGIDYVFYTALDLLTYSLDLIHDTGKPAYNLSKQMYILIKIFSVYPFCLSCFCFNS